MSTALHTLEQNILRWGHDRGILINGKPESQFLKLTSELGELADNIAKGRHIAARDDIGDIIVVLIMIADLINTDITTCLQIAYSDIKDRKGYLNEQGIFIKKGDTGT